MFDKIGIGDNMLFQKKKQVVVKIEGMHCNHCKQKVTSALNNLEGVSTDVDLKNNCAVISYDREIDEEIIKNTLKNAGYSVVSIKML